MHRFWETLKHRMLAVHEAQGFKMRLEVHFLHSCIDCIPKNSGTCSEEQGDVCDIERWYQVRWDVEMLRRETERMFGGASEKKKSFHRRKSNVVLNISKRNSILFLFFN